MGTSNKNPTEKSKNDFDRFSGFRVIGKMFSKFGIQFKKSSFFRIIKNCNQQIKTKIFWDHPEDLWNKKRIF